MMTLQVVAWTAMVQQCNIIIIIIIIASAI